MSTLYMVPTVISDAQIGSLSTDTLLKIRALKYYVAERARTARRFLKLCDLPFSIQEIEIIEMEKDNQTESMEQMVTWLKEGKEVGIISESGMPGIADPGKLYARTAHQIGAKVIPLVGPSSIFLALAASGLNGQDFTFNGYLPVKDHELKDKLQILSKSALKGHCHIFIETPYRNQRIFDFMLKQLSPEILLCVAFDISGPKELIQTQSIKAWKQQKLTLDKTPCIFLLGS